MAVLFETHKIFFQNKIRYKLFLPMKFTFTKNKILFFNFRGKNNLEENLFWSNAL